MVNGIVDLWWTKHRHTDLDIIFVAFVKAREVVIAMDTQHNEIKDMK